MAVWVFARNPARKFYKALGGKVIAEQEIERGGESFVEIAYGWSDLSKFRWNDPNTLGTALPGT